MSGMDDIRTATGKMWPFRLVREGVVSPRLVLFGLFGVALLVAGSLFEPAPVRPRPASVTEPAKVSGSVARSYEEALEAKLAGLLARVKGAGAVAVSVTLESGGAQEYAKNVTRETRTVQEKDTGGGTRTTSETKDNAQILLSRENGAERPVMVREFRPAIKGVLVIAEGAQDSQVKANLTRAVEAGLGIPSYKITVLPQRK